MTTWNSSPIRESTNLQDIRANQCARAQRLYQPMSSPVQLKTQDSNRKREQMRALRDKTRQLRLELGREKTSEREDLEKQLQRLREEADALEADPDVYLHEQEEATAADDYAEELEAYLDEADLELEQQLSDMQLNI